MSDNIQKILKKLEGKPIKYSELCEELEWPKKTGNSKISQMNRLLVKPTKSAISYMPTVTYEIPYENAKEMLLVEEVDNKDFLTGLFDVMYDELPTPKPKKKK